MPKRVTRSFAFGSNPPTVVFEDEVYADDHPFVKAYPDHFEDNAVDVIDAPRRVEQATAAPGERRTVRKP